MGLREDQGFEWYNAYGTIKDTICKYIKKDTSILNIGCGDSNLSEDMYRDGFTDITSCDFSPIVIEKMKEKCSEKKGMKWDVMDIHHMTYADASFDVVLDKGTLDAVICGDETTCFPEKVVSEVYRVLKTGGIYMLITFGMPENRLSYFENAQEKWKVTHISIPKTVVSTQSSQAGIEYCHHVYICEKEGN
ncbi:hypothetical protein BLSTO_01881 [Blastocystis sp. subtype 1]